VLQNLISRGYWLSQDYFTLQHVHFLTSATFSTFYSAEENIADEESSLSVVRQL